MNTRTILLNTLCALPVTISGIVVPTTHNKMEPVAGNVGEVQKTVHPIDQTQLDTILVSVKTLFADFGGYTVDKRIGGWKDSDTNELIEEIGYYVWAYCTPSRQQIERIVITAQAIKAALGQDNVLIVIDSKPYLV